MAAPLLLASNRGPISFAEDGSPRRGGGGLVSAMGHAEEAAPGAAVLVQDYHLSLTPRQLRQRRPDLRIGHFSHTPWAPPEYFRVLPDAIAVDLLTGLLGADAVGFNSHRWADAFARC